MSSAFKILVCKYPGKRHGPRWEGTVNVDLAGYERMGGLM
jgi:hypothetical protein